MSPEEREQLLALLSGRTDPQSRFLRFRLSLHLSPAEVQEIRQQVEAMPPSPEPEPSVYKNLWASLEEPVRRSLSYDHYGKLQQADGQGPEDWRLLLSLLKPRPVAPLQVAAQSALAAKEKERQELLLAILLGRARRMAQGQPWLNSRELLQALERKTNEPLKRLLKQLEGGS